MSTTDERITTYLKALKGELRDADKAVVQDALADAEEHLRVALYNELEGQEDANPGQVLEGIITAYGSPAEIAGAYRNWEPARPPSLTAPPTAYTEGHELSRKRPAPGFFGVYADPRAWGSLIYLLISVVTGTLYFSWALTGFSVSMSAMILIIGVPVTILFLLSVRGLAFLEGRLVEALLGERMPRRPAFTDPSLGWIERLKQLLAGKSTWLALLYMALMLPLGAIYFSVAVTLLATSVALVAAPVIELIFEIPVVQLGPRIYHLPVWGMPLFLAGGALLATITLHLARWVGRTHGKLAKTLLVSD